MGNIAWLASYPKSGNTWLRAFIYNLFVQPHRPGSLSELHHYFESDSSIEWYRPLLGNRQPDSVDPIKFFALRLRVHEQIASRVSDGTVFTKTHNLFGKVNGHPLHNLAVTAGAIVVVRNPLDVVLSMADHFGLGLDETIARMANPITYSPGDEFNVASYLGSWSSHVQSWTAQGHERFLVIRYEDMLDEPIETFGRVASLLGLGDDRERIERAVRYSEFDELRKQEKCAGFAERSPHSRSFFRAGRKDLWREGLTPVQSRLICSQHREVMQRFAYLPEEQL